MGETRSALIVATDQYESAALSQLAAPTADAAALAEVLGDQRLGGFDVEVVLNATSWTIAQRVESLLNGRKPGDLVLVHFSCHGLKDESGELFLAATNTSPELLASTAVEAALVNRLVRRSRAGRIVLMLDCCYGGAFERGAIPRAGGDVDVVSQFPQDPSGGSRGRAIITASSAMEFAFEGTRLRADAGPQPSVFTGALVEGIRSGEADRDQDGFVSLSELYDFVYQRVRAATPNQTPCKWEFDMQGDLHLARNPHRRVQPGALPPDLQALVSSTTTAARLGAVAELVYLAGGSDLSLAAAAQAALLELCRDDSQRVSAAAQDGVVRGAPSLPESVIDLGTGQVRGPPLTVGLPVQGSPLALTSEILSTGSPLHAELESGVLRVSAPTDRAGPIDARITLSGPAGDTTVEVTGSVAAAPGPREQPPEELPEPPETPAPVPGAGTVAPDRETPDGETPDGETPDGDRRPWWIAAGAVAVIAAAIALVVALRPDGTTGTPGDPTGTTATQAVQQQVTVDGTRPFTETGMQLSEGQRVTVTANGQVFHRPGASTGPEGTTEQGLRSPLSTANHNALIARIGPNGPPFLIGPSADFTVWTSGSFQLGINDGGLENNSGSYNAQVVVQPAQ